MCFPSLFVIVFIKTIYTEVVKLSDLNESDLYESSDNLSSSQFFDSLNIEDKTKDDSNVQISLSKTKSSPEKIKRRFSFSNKKKQNKKQNIFFEKMKELKEKIEDDSIIKEYKMIVPFDYENKGVLEPNKEFSGFIQQFIAIKEMLNSSENENMLIKDISMNYLYVSHPIFVNLYSSVCGFTGTVGTKYDKQIFRKHYKLSTKKIPRNAPNHRINLPVILCSSLKKRNEKIVEEVIGFHMMNNPVLVIFKDLNEIFDVYHTLRLKGINNINVFDGKNEKIKPDKISGLFGAVSLGTNVCGRGTDIKEPSNPLHVIVTYYTSNSRVINQAFGRTARQGNEGTVRVICLFDQYNSPQYTLNEESTEEVLKDFSLKNELQIKFIDKYKEKRQWIFDSNIKSQKLSRENIKKMRDAKINVNRIKAYNFKFPICMKVPTFVTIQAQKIFSLYNCPNCKYTWILFQRYMRELILESWSLFISQSDQEYYSKIQSDQKQSKIVTYETFLNNKLNNVKEILKMIIPQDNSENQYDIVSTFMHIFDFVTGMYERRIMSSFPKKISNCYSSNDSDRFCSLFVGFKPYSLYNKSGSRINLLDDDSHEPEFISDPELKYVMKSQNKLKSFVISITQKIDDIFNKLCKKINDVIVCYMGLKFFLRRTLGGCEFGLCFDFELENINEKTCKDFNCLIDKDPLLVFTINVKSMAPIIAGILIIGLVYIAKVASQIAQLISGINIDIAGKVVKKVAKIVIEKIADTLLQNQIEQFVSQVCMFLINAINNQILILKSYNPDLAYIFDLLMLMADVDDFSKCDEKINQLFEGFTFVKMNSSFKQKSKPIKGIFKIGFLLMIAFGSFMMNFQYRHKALKYKTQKVAEDYDKNQKTDEAVTANEKYVQLDVTEN